MSKLKFLLGLWAGKLSVPALKITHHNGTDYPGQLAVKFCPDFLKYIGRPKKLVIITGTNGKTTVNNMLIDILEDNGLKVFNNRAGSNITTGISTVFIKGSNIFGKLKKLDLAVLEVDERSAPKIYPYLNPDYVVITNLSRDSILRNAHPQYIADVLTKAIPENTKMILNADDLISGNVALNNKRAYFGINKLPEDENNTYDGLLNDMQICPKCAGKLKYNYIRYNHIGNAVCEDCGFNSPIADYAITAIDYENEKMTVEENGEKYIYPLITDSMFNIYNLITVISIGRELGLTHEELIKSMSKTKIPGSRHSEDKAGSIRLITQMAKEKNASATTRAFDYVSKIDGPREVLLMMNCLNDTKHWSENPCWMYDTDFELLAQDGIKKIICAGARNTDYRLRLLMAGVPDSKIVCCESEMEAATKLSYDKNDIICLFHGVDSTKLAMEVKAKILELASSKEGKS
ncbi:MAG: MurT ligase domain-containing protein [Lachnospiraceae bacterium]|nr:MurT ligase domain-containing protein [Lachnospiraceae bacterium]